MLKEYFSFTLKERIAIITLVALILGIYLLPHFVKPKSQPPSEKEIQEFRTFEKQLIAAYNNTEKNNSDDDDYTSSHSPPAIEENPPKLFYFDPNSLSPVDWKRLGLRDKTIGTIQKYLSKGGHFYKADDLKKIYGLQPGEYERIKSYIRIEQPGENDYAERKFEIDDSRFSNDDSKHQNVNDKYANEDYKPPPKSRSFEDKKRIIDINKADSADFVSLPGIGNKLASRIINFRDKLGGFYAIEQVAETYGLPDSTFQKIRAMLTLSGGIEKRININTAGMDELKQHPYIRWNLAGAITRYRDQHGAFKNLEDLKQIGAITVEVYKKIVPYLKLE